MQKKIIALAIAAALTAPAMAFAEATVYGKANLSIDMAKDGYVANATSANQLVDNNSRLGFKGSEDLGGGLSAIWQMEAGVNMDNGVVGGSSSSSSTSSACAATPCTPTITTSTKSTQVFNRNTWLGLKSKDMGSVMFGVNDTPYKSATRKLDVFGDQNTADNRKALGVGFMGWGLANARVSNSISYVSPKLGDITIAAQTVFGAETLPQPAAPANNKGSAMSLAGMYDAGAIYGTVAYQTIKFGDAKTGDLGTDGTLGSAVKSMSGAAPAKDDKVDSMEVGVGYKMDAMSFSAIIENMKYTVAAGGDIKGTNLYLGGKFAISGTDAVKAAYTSKGETKSAGSGNKDKATMISLGYDHSMSKTTTVYAIYSKVSQDVNAYIDPTKAATAGADPSAISVGMVHSF